MRKTEIVSIKEEGRDKGKSFLITEMSALQAERWATRVFLAMAKSGANIPDGIENAGMAAMAALTIRALVQIDYVHAEPLLDEMMTCVQFVPDPSNPAIPARRLVESDLEEVATIFKLRVAILELHTGFSFAAVSSMFQPSSTVAQPSI